MPTKVCASDLIIRFLLWSDFTELHKVFDGMDGY